MRSLRPSLRGVGAILALAGGLAVQACERETTTGLQPPVVTITVTPDRLTLSIGTSASLVATVHDAEGRTLADQMVAWASSALEIAAVSSEGVVTAGAPGRATISASSEQSVGFAQVVVQADFRLPLPRGHWLRVTEVGTPTAQCVEDEGGLRQDGGRDCSHAGVSRYSLDLAAVTQEEGGLESVEVLAAANGTVIDICLQLAPETTCGPNGPFVTMEHSGGFRTIYAHLDPASVTVRRKMPVTRGQPLGVMGAGGATPEAWVHFELRFENQGAEAAAVLEALLVDGRKLIDYQVGTEEPRFYPSTN
jgi:murein DD-endopeptidase MepM/ murein hydrolase activator NlpD